LFALDALQLRARVNPALAERYDFVSAWWLIKLCAASVILFVLALSALRAAKRMRRERKVPTEQSASLLVGSTATPPRVATSPSP